MYMYVYVHVILYLLSFSFYTVSSGKKRELKSKATMPKKISELEIICKV